MDDQGTTIAGFRLVRALRRTPDREVWVAADASAAAGAPPSGVEVHRSVAGQEAVLAREVEAVLAAAHPHLVPIDDVATDDGVVVVRPLLPHDLAAWLLARGAPQPGEAVTALAPVAAALGALHGVGAALGGLVAHDVRLDADGAPLLTGEGARIEIDRPSAAWREASDRVAADAAGWRELALLLADASGTALPDAVEHAIEARDLCGAADALLAAWPALPLAIDAAVTPAAAPRPRMRRRERAVGLEAVWARVALLLERIPAAGVALERGRAALGAVRPRVWALGGAGAVALVAAAVVVGTAGTAGAAGSAGAGVAASTAAPSTDVPSAEASSTEAPADTPAPEAPDTAVPAATSGTDAAAGMGGEHVDDPLLGATALLAEREACLGSGDAACLVVLHEPASPQLTAPEPWRMPDDGTLEVVQRLGDAWLLRVRSEREPASVLVMSTEAGWTLRDAWSD